MTDYTRRIRKELSDAGWRFHRQGKGDHEIWIELETGEKVTVDGKVRNRALANKDSERRRLGKEVLTWPM